MADSDLDRIEGLTSQIKQSIDDDVRFAEVVEELDALLYLLDNASLQQKKLSEEEVRRVYEFGIYLSSDSTLKSGQYARGFYLWHSVKLLEIAAKSPNASQDILKKLSVYSSNSISEAAKRHPNNPLTSFA